MSSLGALSSAFLNFTLLSSIDSETKIYYQYGIISVLILVIGLTYSCFCLKGGNEYYARNAGEKRNFSEMFRVGIDSIKKPQIGCGYIAAFLARSDSILLSLYLVLWAYSFREKE